MRSGVKISIEIFTPDCTPFHPTRLNRKAARRPEIFFVSSLVNPFTSYTEKSGFSRFGDPRPPPAGPSAPPPPHRDRDAAPSAVNALRPPWSGAPARKCSPNQHYISLSEFGTSSSTQTLPWQALLCATDFECAVKSFTLPQPPPLPLPPP